MRQKEADGSQTLILNQPEVDHAGEGRPVGPHKGNGRKHRCQGCAETWEELTDWSMDLLIDR